MKKSLKLNIYFVVTLISILLTANIAITHLNNRIIEKNRSLQIESEKITMYTERIAKSIIQPVDIGLRGYALIGESRFSYPMEISLSTRESVYGVLEAALKEHGYPMDKYYELRDSVESYCRFSMGMLQLLKANKRDQFVEKLRQDKGEILWELYTKRTNEISSFEQQINATANKQYQDALQANYIFQIVLFLICFPTLLYTAYRTRQMYQLSRLLEEAHIERNKILADQNLTLEKMVALRTTEIVTQNEEITSQSEEIAAQRDTLSQQNKELLEAKNIIASQNLEIQKKNNELEKEVLKRTQELVETNGELISQNHQLEQFAFMAAHNLRAPVARILGLANLMHLPSESKSLNEMLDRLDGSVAELDCVIHDLSRILDLRNHTPVLEKLDLATLIPQTIGLIQNEGHEVGLQFVHDYKSRCNVIGVTSYLENIMVELFTNAIRYRDHGRNLLITIKISEQDGMVCLAIQDNGLGFDLGKHRKDLFTLYKKFHQHIQGKGLGLYLVKNQVTAMGGQIDVASEVGEGTTFTILLRQAHN